MVQRMRGYHDRDPDRVDRDLDREPEAAPRQPSSLGAAAGSSSEAASPAARLTGEGRDEPEAAKKGPINTDSMLRLVPNAEEGQTSTKRPSREDDGGRAHQGVEELQATWPENP